MGGKGDGAGVTTAIDNREPWLTKREVAARLRVHPRTVTRLRLPFIRVGGQNRYIWSQVERALAAGSDDPMPDNVVQLRPGRRESAA